MSESQRSHPPSPAISAPPRLTGAMEMEVAEECAKKPQRNFVLADLNDDPPEVDDDDTNSLAPAAAPYPDTSRITMDENSKENSLDNSQDRSGSTCKESQDGVEGDGKKTNKMGKCRSRNGKTEDHLDYGAEGDGDQQSLGTPSSREEKVSSLKTALVHVARKAPKNAHAHFLLGLMYQRLGQPQKAVSAYEKAEEILLSTDEEIIKRPGLLATVQVHHAQCLLLESLNDCNLNKELEPDELDEIILKLKESVQSDFNQATVWNTFGVILLRTGRLQNAISLLSSLYALVPDNLDCLGNLGLAYMQSGCLEAALNCLQELLLKDQGHPAALMNYATALLSKYGSVIAGAGANSGDEASSDPVVAANVAKELLLVAVKTNHKAAHIWANLSNAYHIIGDHRSAAKCLEKAAKLEPNCMATRYSAAVHRVKDAERSQSSDQLSLAGNEMASILREGDPSVMDTSIAWSGLAMADKAQHEISSVYDKTEKNKLYESRERAMSSLKQAVGEDPDDMVQWNQLGIYGLSTLQFKMSQKFLKAAVAHLKECSYTWSNLGVSLQLTGESSAAESVFKRALSLSTPQHSHVIFSNLGNLYRQRREYDSAKAMFSKSLEVQPGYAPAYNNLGLVFVAEGLFEEAKFCFNKALGADPLLDAAKSNMVKIVALSKICKTYESMDVD